MIGPCFYVIKDKWFQGRDMVEDLLGGGPYQATTWYGGVVVRKNGCDEITRFFVVHGNHIMPESEIHGLYLGEHCFDGADVDLYDLDALVKEETGDLERYTPQKDLYVVYQDPDIDTPCEGAFRGAIEVTKGLWESRWLCTIKDPLSFMKKRRAWIEGDGEWAKISWSLE